MAIILNSDDKVKSVIEALNPRYTFEEFLAEFKHQHEKDWLKVVREHTAHEMKTKPGKSHPMPEPTQYLRNVLNVYLKKNKPVY
jgi:hypothetical protein